MLVFIDESGDAGFKLDKGSSPIFAAVMVIFNSVDDARATEAVIRDAMNRLKAAPEFKFNKASDTVRDGFFQAVRGCPFRVRAVAVRKATIYSPHLKAEKEDFYRFFIRQMMTHDDGALTDAKVTIDGSGDRGFRRMLESSLRRQVGTKKIMRIGFSNSRNDPLVQLADMCVGAIARSYRTDRQDAWRWRTMLTLRINDVWDFK